METIAALWDIVVHLDRHLAVFVAEHGAWVYALLFVTGTLAAAGGMDIAAVMAVLIAAALCGDNVNYWIGRKLGPQIFRVRESRWFNPRHLESAHAFYQRHGGKTIILARFLPIVRTYVPFVAGIGAMPYLRYLAFCVAGALIWVLSLCLAGYFFGNLPAVKSNLSLVILGILLLSISPGVYAWTRARLRARRASVQR